MIYRDDGRKGYGGEETNLQIEGEGKESEEKGGGREGGGSDHGLFFTEIEITTL